MGKDESVGDHEGHLQWQKPEELTLEQLAKMDGGRLGEAVKQALGRIAHDMDDRPGEQRARSLTIKLAFKPEVDETGSLDGCKMAAAVEETTPSRKSKVYDLGVRKKRGGGMMVYQATPLFDDPED